MNIIRFTVMIISVYMKERYKMIFGIGLAIIIIDQIIKVFVCINIPYGTNIGKWIRLTNISNTGMAYSIRRK